MKFKLFGAGNLKLPWSRDQNRFVYPVSNELQSRDTQLASDTQSIFI